MNYLLLAVVLAGTLFGVVTLLGLERVVLSRVSAIRSRVGLIERIRDLSQRLSVQGNDELASLGDELNRMLDQLQAAEE